MVLRSSVEDVTIRVALEAAWVVRVSNILFHSRGSPFSYSVEEEDNELLIYNYKSFRLHIGGRSKYVKQS